MSFSVTKDFETAKTYFLIKLREHLTYQREQNHVANISDDCITATVEFYDVILTEIFPLKDGQMDFKNRVLIKI